jgi:hypothetical protein
MNRLKRRSLIFFIFLILFTLQVKSGVSDNFTKSFEPTDDSYVDSSNPDSNYRNADLKVKFWNLSSTNFSKFLILLFH